MMRQIVSGLPILLLTACSPSPLVGPDYTPIEDGMRFLGVALVVAVLVAVLGIPRKGGSK